MKYIKKPWDEWTRISDDAELLLQNKKIKPLKINTSYDANTNSTTIYPVYWTTYLDGDERVIKTWWNQNLVVNF